MDDLRFGGIVRAARIRRRWRQADLASKCEVSRAVVSRIERGQVEEVSLRSLRVLCAALDIRVELLPRSRHADLERTANARHAALAEHVLGWLRSFAGWVARPEVSFAFYADRGVVDILAWHAATRTVLVIELKTEIVDVGETLGTLDRKRRIAAQLAATLGWQPLAVGVVLLIGDSALNRRRVAAHRTTFHAALPDGGRALRRWLRGPSGSLRSIAFVAGGSETMRRRSDSASNARHTSVRTEFAAPRRVAAPRPRSPKPD